MSRAWSAREICERALRNTGVFPITETAARPEEMDEALKLLDAILAHLAATRKRPFLIPATVTFALPLTASFDVLAQMGDDAPADGVQFPVSAALFGPTLTTSTMLPLVRRQTYDDVDDKAKTGKPTLLHITPDERPRGYIYPIPERTGYQVSLTFQAYSDTVTTDINARDQRKQGWNLYLMTALQAEIGGGFAQLDEGEVQRYYGRARELLAQLDSYANNQHPKPGGQIAYTDF